MTELFDQQESADPPDWDLLSALFAQGGSHRHKMGLRRADAREFYAATAAGPAIRREKQAISLRHDHRYTVVTREGHQAAVEFARLWGVPAGEPVTDDEAGWQIYNWRLGLALEPDLLIVQPPDWSLVWANVCAPSRWSLEGKARRPLSWIHDAVPGLNNELGSKVATFFSRLPAGEGWRRANWGLSASCRRNQHPTEPIPALDSTSTPDQIFLRVEDQHLLKLPETGAIAFGIRIASFAWSAVRQNEAIAGCLLDQLRTMPPEVALYKGLGDVIPKILENR